MIHFIATFFFFSIAILFFVAALKFSNFKGEAHNKCEDEKNCVLKKLGIKKLQCDH